VRFSPDIATDTYAISAQNRVSGRPFPGGDGALLIAARWLAISAEAGREPGAARRVPSAYG